MATKLGKIVADFTTSLASSMAVGATSVSLQSATDDDGIALPAGVYFFAIDGNNAQKEHIVATLSGTSLTAISSVSRQGVQASGVVRTHRVGSTVALTDFAHIKYINDLLAGTTNLDASTPLGYDGTASITTANQLATKAYVDGVAIAGGADSSTTVKGLTKMSVAPASATSPIAVGDNDGRVPTQNENDALVGTSGSAVSSSNKLVDNSDTSAASSASKVHRLDAQGKSALATTYFDYQPFTASGTWTKPTGLTGTETVLVQIWGAGGAGGGVTAATGHGGGGGGGCFSEMKFRASDLGATVTVTIGGTTTGGNGNGSVGTSSTFGSLLTGYGGGGGASGNSQSGGGGGGGGGLAVGATVTSTTGGAGGVPGAGAAGGFESGGFGGGGGGTGGAGGRSAMGGGGGGSNSGAATGAGGQSMFGGGGGGGADAGGATTGGTSIQGGAGGAGAGVNGAGSAGSTPGGGGGGAKASGGTVAGGNGARGECRVWVLI